MMTDREMFDKACTDIGAFVQALSEVSGRPDIIASAAMAIASLKFVEMEVPVHVIAQNARDQATTSKRFLDMKKKGAN